MKITKEYIARLEAILKTAHAPAHIKRLERMIKEAKEARKES